MNAVFLDTSGAIALLHSGDRHHDKARELATRFRGERRSRITTTAVLSELGDGFVRKKRWEVFDSFDHHFQQAEASRPTLAMLHICFQASHKHLPYLRLPVS